MLTHKIASLIFDIVGFDPQCFNEFRVIKQGLAEKGILIKRRVNHSKLKKEWELTKPADPTFKGSLGWVKFNGWTLAVIEADTISITLE